MLTLSEFDHEPRAQALGHEYLLWKWAFAENNIPTFPCGWDKRPLIKNWRETATTDRRQIEAWSRKWPLSMIGVPMGQRSQRACLDVDCKNGVDGFATLRTNGWIIPTDAIEVRTPSGGAHFYFRYTGAERNSAGKLGPGLDIRGEGGYVIVPPSRPSLNGPDYHYAEGQELEMGVL